MSAGPFYHDFSRLGLRNEQPPGKFRRNQMAKEPVITAYLLLAIAKLKNRGIHPITMGELFCADAYYSTFARKFGADSATAFDNNKEGFLDQARVVRELLGSDVNLVCTDVHEIPAETRFSIVSNTGGLYHVDDPAETLQLSYRLAEHYLIIQSLVSLEHTSPSYFERPAPGWTWGSRFSRDWFDALIRKLGYRVIDQEFNLLDGNALDRDRGSVYYLVEVR